MQGYCNCCPPERCDDLECASWLKRVPTIFRELMVVSMSLRGLGSRLAMSMAVVGSALIALPGSAGAASLSGEEKLFYTGGDYVHISSTPPRSASGHGWWVREQSDALEAVVTVQLQINRGGYWVDVGEPGKERVKPGGGSANRASARAVCLTFDTNAWRSVIDTDLVGYLDSPDKLITPVRTLPCGA
jgi:hypothetical protein